MVVYMVKTYGTSWKVAGSVPNVVIEFFKLRYPSSCSMALGFTQPLTEMSTRRYLWGQRAAGT
jgi:hypothetical protein